MLTISAFLLAFLLVLLVTPFIRKISLQAGVLDVPNQRKIHSVPVPLLGGLGIFLGVIVTFVFFKDSFRVIWPVIIGATVMLYMGALDDIRGLSAHLRLIVQLMVCTILFFLDVRVTFLPHTLWGNIGEYIITLIWLSGVTNAYNYLDGMDGLCAGSAVINFLCFFVILYNTGQYAYGLAAVILMAGCFGFLPYNFSRKFKVFLGDGGSTFLGFTLAGMSITGDWASDNMVKLFIPILILGVPIFDMIFTTIMRIKEGKVKNVVEWLKYGGKDHFHHYLVDLGFSPKAAVVLIYYFSISLGLSAIMVSNDNAVEGVLTILQGFILFAIIGALIVVGKKRHNGWDKREG